MREDAGDLDVRAKVEGGEFAPVIVREADHMDADLIVMGTHGRKGIDRILFGSVAEKVVKNASMPVLTVRPNR